MSRLGAIVLTGGTAVRLDGADKAGLEIGGETLLERVLAALVEIPDVPGVVIVGDDVPTSRPVTFRREDPPGGGPLAGLIAGLGGFPRAPEWVCVLAVDLPMVSSATIARLWLNRGADGAVLVDGAGRRQYLCAIYSATRLRELAPDDAHGASVRAVVDRLDLAEVEAVGLEARDVDTWADVRQLRETLAPPEGSGQ